MDNLTVAELQALAEKHLSRRASILKAVKKYNEKKIAEKAEKEGKTYEEYKSLHYRGNHGNPKPEKVKERKMAISAM